MSLALYTITAEYRQQAAQLAELDLDDQTLADTLESLQWPVEEKAKAVSAVIGQTRKTALGGARPRSAGVVGAEGLVGLPLPRDGAYGIQA